MGRINATTFCICLISSIACGCVPIPVPLLPGDGIYKVEMQLDELVESRANKTDVIAELGSPLKYRAMSMHYKACREGGGGGLLLVAMGGMGAHLAEFRGDAVCVELLLKFDINNRLLSYEEIPWGADVDFDKEDINLERLANNGDAIAKQLWLKSVRDDIDLSLGKSPRQLEALAEQGDAKAQLQLYWNDPNDSSALMWLCRSADQGETEAQYRLGLLFEKGVNGVPKDHAQAYMWYRHAAIPDNYMKSSHQAKRLFNNMTSTQKKQSDLLIQNWEPGQCERELAP